MLKTTVNNFNSINMTWREDVAAGRTKPANYLVSEDERLQVCDSEIIECVRDRKGSNC